MWCFIVINIIVVINLLASKIYLLISIKKTFSKGDVNSEHIQKAAYDPGTHSEHLLWQLLAHLGNFILRRTSNKLFFLTETVPLNYANIMMKKAIAFSF
jgi:hypothetical protein